MKYYTNQNYTQYRSAALMQCVLPEIPKGCLSGPMSLQCLQSQIAARPSEVSVRLHRKPAKLSEPSSNLDELSALFALNLSQNRLRKIRMFQLSRGNFCSIFENSCILVHLRCNFNSHQTKRNCCSVDWGCFGSRGIGMKEGI